MSSEYKIITVKTKDLELFKRYKLLFGLGRVVTENLLRQFLKRVDLIELRNIYVAKGEDGVEELIDAMFNGLFSAKQEAKQGCEPTYEELKHCQPIDIVFSAGSVASLPMRN